MEICVVVVVVHEIQLNSGWARGQGLDVCKGWMSVVTGLIKKGRLVAAGGSTFSIIVIACLLIV